jgi:hypothetical protein
MPDRVPVQDLYKDRGYLPETRPTARPVDTFVQPGHPVHDDHGMYALVDAFKEIQPGLERFASERFQRANEIDIEAGHAAALKSKEGFKEAVKSGAIPAGASPWFQVGWERQRARVASADYDTALREGYASSGLVEQNDPKAFDAWVADFTKSWQQQHPENNDNPEFTSVFGQMAAHSQSSLANAHAAARTVKIENDVVDNTGRELEAAMDRHLDLIGTQNPHTGEELSGIVAQQVANGLDGQLANKLVAQTIIRRAIADEDVTILDLADEVPSGSGMVGQIGYVKDMIAAARKNITASKIQGDRIAHLENKAKRSAAIDKLRGDAYAKIFDSPYANTREEFLQLNAYDPDEAAKVESFRTALLSSLTAQNKVIENPSLVTDMRLAALQGNLTDEQVVNAVHGGDIGAESAKELFDLTRKAHENKGITQDPIVTIFSKDITNVITKNGFSGEGADQMAYRASKANETFLKGMIRFKELNPKADQLQIIKHGAELKDGILNAYRVDSSEPLPPVNFNAMDPTRFPMFPDRASLNEAIQEFAQTGGSSGKLKTLADMYQMRAHSFISAQSRLFSGIGDHVSGAQAPPLGAEVSPDDMNSWLGVLRNPMSPAYDASVLKLQQWAKGIGEDGKLNPNLKERAKTIAKAHNELVKVQEAMPKPWQQIMLGY